MFEIREGMKQVNDVVVDTFERDIMEGDTFMEAEAGTTGFCGGNREEGGRAYVRISALNADFFARVTKDEKGRPDGLEIAVSGDDDIMALVKALWFAHRALIEQINGEDE